MSKFSELIAGTPIIPARVYNALPDVLKTCTRPFDDPRERDIVLTGSLVTLSGCFDGITGKYHNDFVGPNLYAFVVAPAASGKGSGKYPRMLGQPIQDALLTANEKNRQAYHASMKQWEKDSKDGKEGLSGPPSKPRFPVLFIPGNTSSSSIYQLLSESDGVGIMYETEADSLSGALKNEWGNFSDILRKAFHHESITMSRKTDGQYTEIPKPRLSIFLTGTPDQVPRLIKSAEDGLCSRFIFYVYEKEPVWQDPTPCDACPDVSDLFRSIGKEIQEISDWLKTGECQFTLTKAQFAQLNTFFSGKIDLIRKFGGDGTTATTFRLGLICYRIAMILTLLRQYRPDQDRSLVCTDEDFSTALMLTEVFFEHAMVMLSMLPQQTKQALSPRHRQFYALLPNNCTFPKRDANVLGAKIGIRERSVTNYLNDLVKHGYLINTSHGVYQKLE